MQYNAFPGTGRFFKGCLHVHTSRSDGQLEPHDVLKVYHRSGYDFVALTDHSVFNRNSYGMEDKLLVLPAVEVDTNHVQMDTMCKCHHFVVLARDNSGMIHDQRIVLKTFSTSTHVQAFINELISAGNLVMLCHPVWSNTTIEDYGTFKGLFSVEVFNTGCHYAENSGFAHRQWHDLLRKNVRIYASSVDDAHSPKSMNGGWIQVFAPVLSQSAIINSLENGWFYASTGPEIHAIYVEDDTLFIQCSPCKQIMLLTDRIGSTSNKHVSPPNGGRIIEAQFRIPSKAKFMRVECIESENKIAWSQPIWLDILTKNTRT